MLASRAPHGHNGEAFHDERAASVMATGTLNQERTVRVGHWQQLQVPKVIMPLTNQSKSQSRFFAAFRFRGFGVSIRCTSSTSTLRSRSSGLRGWFGPRMFTGHTEHRCDCVIAERHHRSLVFPARTRDVHLAVDDDIGGISHGRTSLITRSRRGSRSYTEGSALRRCRTTGGSPSIRSDHVNRHDAQRKVTMVSERTSRTVSRAPHVGSGHFTWKAAATLVGGGDSGCMVDGS